MKKKEEVKQPKTLGDKADAKRRKLGTSSEITLVPSIALAEAPQLQRTALFDPEIVRRDFTSAVFADSHGAFDGFLGAGGLYYSLAYSIRAQVSVCIGSGGGFVPSLLRRAQIDAEIEPACTYLVDANLPDLGFGSPVQLGGWMTGESMFLKRENDIAVLTMLSSDAARLFAAHALAIDYLHIDGNHSTKGVLADFSDFAPLMSPHAVITLHDLRLPSVEKALARITDEYPEWQILTFPEIGAGSVVLRRRLSTTVPRRAQNKSGFVHKNRLVTFAAAATRQAIEESRQKAIFERWDYLASAAYRLRYDIVARYLDAPKTTIVEIGGYPNSVLGSFTKLRCLHAIEPYAPDEFVEQLEQQARKLKAKFFLHRGRLGSVDMFWSDVGSYRLVALGLDLTSGFADEAAVLEGLNELALAILGAELVAIEIPRYAPSLATFAVLEGLLIGRKLADVTLDLSKDPAGDDFYVKDSRAIRRMVIFEPLRGFDPQTQFIRDRLSAAAHEIYAAKVKEIAPAEASYHLGDEIVFTADGNSSLFKREGWVGAEARFSWTNGPESWLALYIDAPRSVLQSAKGYTLTIEAKPFTVKGRLDNQSLAIAVNGYQVHSGVYSAAEVISVDVPTSVIIAKHPVRIQFTHPNCRRPAEIIEDSHDQKLLGFAVNKIILSARS